MQRIVEILKKIPLKIISVFIISFSILGLFYLVYSQQEILRDYEWKIDLISFVFGVVFYVLSFLLAVYIWGKIIAISNPNMSYWINLKHYSITNLGKRIPGSVWYIPLRFQRYQDKTTSRKSLFVYSVFEVIAIYYASVIVSAIFAFSFYMQYSFLILIIFFTSIIIPIVLYSSKFNRFLNRITKVEINFKNVHPKYLLNFIFYYVILRILGGLFLFFIVKSLFNLNVSYLFYIIGCWSLTGLWNLFIIFSPTNIGLTEIGLTFLLSTLIPTPIAVIISVIIRIVILFIEIFLTLLILYIDNIKNNIKKKLKK